MNTLTKAQQSRVLALMCSGHPITVCAPQARPQRFTTHTGHVVPEAGFAGDAYLAEFMGDQAIIPVIDEDGFIVGEDIIARKRGHEWREELELQESGEIVGYWGEGQ